MSTPFDQMIKHFGDQALSQMAIEKQSRLNQKVLEKRTDLDPNFIEFHPELWDVLDSDTIRHKITGENVRLTVGPGYSSDAWETDEERYKLNPDRFKAHREAYAAQFGKDPADVSIKDLVEAGKSQTYNMRENLMSLSGRGMGLTRTGTDDYGRTIAQFDDPSVLAPITGNEGNANYFSKYNWRQLREDRLNDFGALAKPDRSFLRMVGDQSNNFIYGGVLPIASSTLQGLGNIIGANNIEFVNEFFDYFNESVERTQDFFASDEQKAREKFDEKEKGLLRNLEQVRIDEYMKDNPNAPAWVAHMAAATDAWVDRVEYLKENPGRIIDAGVESLPYMLGVGAVGRAVTIKASRKMSDDFLEALTKKQIARPRYPAGTPGGQGGRFAPNADALRLYQNSPEYAKQLRRIQSNTGATVVGITEGLSNAGDVYTRVRNMTEEEAFQSEKYTQLRARGFTHKEATTKLAKQSFNDVLITSTIMAGIASKITGAAGFEARLFAPFQRKVPGIRPENRLYRWSKATGKTVGSFVGPGAREFAEETMQSGGGSFLSELASYNALGEGFEPSVSRAFSAAAEGGIVGFASGAVAGGSGALLRNIGNLGQAGINKIKKAGATKLGEKQEFDIVSKNADGSFNFAGNPQTALNNLSKQGAKAEDLFLAAIDTSDGKLFLGEALVYFDAMTEAQQKKHLSKWTDAQKKFDNEVGFLATSTAKGLNTEKKVKKAMQDEGVIRLLRYAHQKGKIKPEVVAAMPKEIQGFFNVIQETENAVQEAAQAVEAANQGKTQQEVFREKMGAQYGPKGGGLRWYVENMQALMGSGPSAEAAYIRLDQRLASFLQSQAKKYQATKEMVDRYKAGEDPTVFQDEVNQKYGTDVKWVPEDPRVKKFNEENGTNNLSGTLYFESLQIPELIKMGRVRRQLAKEAQHFMGPLKTLQQIQNLEMPTPGVLDNAVPGTETEAAAQGASAASDAGRKAEVEGAPEASKEPVSEDDAAADREADKQADREAEREAEQQAAQEAARGETTESRPEPAAKPAAEPEAETAEEKGVIPEATLQRYRRITLNIADNLDRIGILSRTRTRYGGFNKTAEELAEHAVIVEELQRENEELFEIRDAIEKEFPNIKKEIVKRAQKVNASRRSSMLGGTAGGRPARDINTKFLAEIGEWTLDKLKKTLFGKVKKLKRLEAEQELDSELYAIIDSERIALEQEITNRTKKEPTKREQARQAAQKRTEAAEAPAEGQKKGSLFETIKRYTRELIGKNPNKIFVFGDNVRRIGRGGQAKEARGMPNVVGIRTKYAPNNKESAFFGKDIEKEKAMIDEDFEKLVQFQKEGKIIVWPEDGIGSGLAELEKRAPDLVEHINAWVERLQSFEGAPAEEQTRETRETQETEQKSEVDEKAAEAAPHVQKIEKILKGMKALREKAAKGQKIAVKALMKYYEDYLKAAQPLYAGRLHKYNPFNEKTDMPLYDGDLVVDSQNRVYRVSHYFPKVGNPTVLTTKRQTIYVRPSVGFNKETGEHEWGKRTTMPATALTLHKPKPTDAKATKEATDENTDTTPQTPRAKALLEFIRDKFSQWEGRIVFARGPSPRPTAEGVVEAGRYDRATKRVILYLDTVAAWYPKVDEARFVAAWATWHELHHAGFHTFANTNRKYNQFLNYASQNETVWELAQGIAKRRKEEMPNTGPRMLIYIEEALVELATAHTNREDGGFQKLQEFYGVDVSSLQGEIGKVTRNWMRLIKEILAVITGKEYTEVTNADVGKIVDLIVNQTRAIGVSEAVEASENAPSTPRATGVLQDGVPLSEDDRRAAAGETTYAVDPATGNQVFFSGETLLVSRRGETMAWGPIGRSRTFKMRKMTSEEFARYNALQKGHLVKIVFNEGKPYLLRVVMKKQLDENSLEFTLERVDPATALETRAPRKDKPNTVAKTEEVKQEEQKELEENPPPDVEEKVPTSSFDPVPDKVVEQPSKDALDQTPTEKEVEKEPEKTAEGKVVPTGELLDQLRWLIQELEVLQDPAVQANFPAGGNPTTQEERQKLAVAVHLSHSKAQEILEGLILNYGKNLTEAVEDLKNKLLKTYDETILAQPVSTPVDATTRAAMDSAVQIAKEGETDSLNMTQNTDKVDFLSDTMVKWLAKFASGLIDWQLRDKRPWDEWTKEEIERVRAALQQRFAMWGLPSKVSDLFTKGKDKTSNLFTAVPNLFSMLQNNGTMMHIMRSMNASINEAMAMRRVLNFAEEFEQKFREIAFGVINEVKDNPDSMQRSIFRRTGFKTDAQGVEIANPLREYVVQYMMDENGNLDENMVGIMAFEMAMWMSSSGAATLGNDQRTINSILGLPEESEIGKNPDAVKMFGNGTIASQVAAQVGRRIVDNSNMKWAGNRNIAPIMQEAAISSFGLMAIAVAQRMGYLTITPVEGKVREMLRRVRDKDGIPIRLEAKPLEDTTFGGSGQNINLVYLSTKGNTGKDRFTPSNKNESLASAITQSKRILGDFFGSRSYEVGPVFDGPPATPGIIARGRTAINKSLRNAIAHNSAFEWIPDRTATSLLNHFENDEFATLFMESRLSGIINQEREEGVHGKNIGNERALRQVRDHLSEHGDSTFWFGYKMIRSGRIYIDSNLINPQAIKLHRWMFVMKEWKNTMQTTDDVASAGGKSYENFLLAVGLGLGVDIDKLSRADAIQQVRDKLSEPDTQKAIQILMDPTMLQGDPGTENKLHLARVTASHHGGEQVHALVALQNVAAIQAAARDNKKKVDIYLPMEVDGKTNGFSASLLQTPISNEQDFQKIKQLLTATGVFFENPELKAQFKSFHHFVEANGTDNYESVADGTNFYAALILDGKIPLLQDPPSKKYTGILKKIQENSFLVRTINAGGFLTIDRKFAKDPLMVTSYGAGMASTRRAIVQNGVDKLYEMVESATTAKAFLDIIMRYEGIVRMQRGWDWGSKKEAELRAAWNKDIKKDGLEHYRRTWKMTTQGEFSFRVSLDALYGHALQASLEDKLGPLLKVRQTLNEAADMMNRIFVKNFKRQVRIQEEVLMRELSGRERKLILKRMIRNNEVPLIRTPLSENHMDSLEITSDGDVIIGRNPGNNDEGRKARAVFKKALPLRTSRWIYNEDKGDENQSNYILEDVDDVNSFTASLLGYQPDENIGVSALVKLIHSSDGAVNGQLMGRHAMLNVHDAQVGNFNKIDEISKDANETYFNIHRDWNMATEFYNSLKNMMKMLGPQDQRLSAQDKAEILQEHAEQRVKYGDLSEEDLELGALELANEWFRGFTVVVQDIQEARKRLFQEIKYINQFAKDGTSWRKTGRYAPRPDDLVEPTTLDEAIRQIVLNEGEVYNRRKAEIIDRIIAEGATLDKIKNILIEWFEDSSQAGHSPSAADVLDVLSATLQQNTTIQSPVEREHFRKLMSVLRPALTIYHENPETGKTRGKPIWVRVLDKNIKDKSAFLGNWPVHFSRPQLEQGIIWVNPQSENIIKDLLEGFAFVASIVNLEQLQENSPERFTELQQEMEKWEKKTGRRAEGGETKRLQTLMNQRMIVNGEKKGPLFKLATWLSHTTSTTMSNQQGQLRFVFRADQVNFLKNLANALTKSDGRTAFYNTGTNNLNPREFEKVQGESLTADTFRDIWQKLLSVENAKLSKEDLAFLQDVVDKFALPGLKSVDDLILKMVHKPNGQRRLGMWLNNPRNNEIWLQTTSLNYLSSNEDMTAQEALLHEILHAIIAEAIGYSYTDRSTGQYWTEVVVRALRHDLRNELSQLYDLTLTALVEKYGGYDNAYQVFLPNQEDLSANPRVEHEAAKRRFNHIFNEDQKNLHEFAVIAVTNRQFRKILSKIEDNRTEGPIFEGGIFQSIWNIVEKIIEWFRSELLRQGESGMVDEAVMRVVQKMVHAQAKHRARVAKGYDGTVLRQKLDQMDAVDLQNLAKQITGKLVPRLAQYSLTGQELREELDNAGKIERLLKTARGITANASQADLAELRDHFDSAINWVRKDHWLYEMMTELLPWADRNRGWIDMLRKSESLIDMVRQQRYEHGRSSLRSFFDKKTWRNMKTYQREAITRTLLETDIGVMRRGVINVKTSQELLNIMKNKTVLEAELNAMRTQLEQSINNPELWNLVQVQMQSLAHFMVHGEVRSPVHAMNAYIITQQWNVPVSRRMQYTEAQQAEQEELIDKIVSLMAFKRADSADVTNMLEIMQNEMLRPVQVNGFNGVLGMHDQFVDLSNKYLFNEDKSPMIKGYTSTITDPEIDVQIVVNDPNVTTKWEQAGYIRDVTLVRDAREAERPEMVLYYKKKGIAGYVKSVISITNETNRGTGVFDSFFQVTPVENQDPSLTAAQAYNHIAKLRNKTYTYANRIMNGDRLLDESYSAPLWNQQGQMVDYRYMMNKDLQRKILKKRDSFDEVLPRMMGTIEDKTNTKSINREVVDRLYQEYVNWRSQDPNTYEREDYRFVEIGADVETEEGREMWRLLPEDTKRHARAAFGADVMYVRDDVVNLVLGFRKIAWSDNKFLGKYAPVVDVGEKIWLEVIKWIRFKIAVLTPEVVIGNMISNWSLLISRGIPPNYIIRESYKAIKAMNLYQKDLRRFNELNNKINAMEREGQDTRLARNQLSRLESSLNTSVVAPLVEEGMFTSIVEDFGSDQDSLRRKATAKILDKFGGFVGVHQTIRVAEEAFMVPGSELGRAAIKATQYGDFIGRFVQYNWQTQVGRKQKQLTTQMKDEIKDLRLAQDTWEKELLRGPGSTRALELRDNIRRAESAVHKIIRSAPTVRVKSDPRDAVHDALSTFIYYNIPQNRWLQFANDNGFMMFTKFFFRIQHIMARIIKENPVSATGVIAGQWGASSLLDSKMMGENIFNYGGLSGIERKFTFMPWNHVWNIDLLKPTMLKWIPDVFYGE